MCIVNRYISIAFGLIGLFIILFGFYFYHKTARNIKCMSTLPDFPLFAIPIIIAGLCLVGSTFQNEMSIAIADSNKKYLISVNAENTDNEKVIMKFEGNNNSTYKIKVQVKEKFTKDKKKHNKYSLKEIKNGYVIYYIAEDVDIPSKPTLEYFNGTKPLKNVVKE